MEPEKKPDAAAEATPNNKLPADALSRTPEELEAETHVETSDVELEDLKKMSPLQRVLRKVNVYFMIFLLLTVIAGVVTIVYYVNSQQEPEVADVATQELTEETLQQLANNDASVGDTSQTLTIQGNAVIAGQTLIRSNLNVAGNIQTGGAIQGPSLTVSGTSNLSEVQINNLQVATNVSIQGTSTLRELNVSGNSSFSGSLTAAQITVTRLILSGNAVLEVPNHVSFTGSSPAQSSNSGVLGTGGSFSVSGSDTAGTINISTGNNPTAGCFGRITFNTVYTSTPHVIASPVGRSAGLTSFYTERDTTGFNICTANAAPANQSFNFDYFVTF